MIPHYCTTARPAATKTVPRERPAQRRRGAEKDQEETPCMVFSESLRLCAKKPLRECVILTDCSEKKRRHKFFSLSSLRSFAARVFLELGDVGGVQGPN